MADFSTIARPYAKAVFEIARDSSKFDAWSDRLDFWSALVSHPDMASRLEAPGFTHQDRAAMIEKVDDKMDDESRSFIRLLAENNRLGMMGDIREIFEVLRAEEEGEIEASVTTAFPLSDAQRQNIVEALGKRLNRKVRLIETVDDSLIGGAVIRAGDLVIDGSLKGRVDTMANAVNS